MTANNEVLTRFGHLTEHGQRWLTREDVLTVQTSVDLRTTFTGVVIPAGTVGKVLYADLESIIINFGLVSVQRLPLDSDLIEVG